MKIILFLIIISSCTFAGYSLSKKYFLRVTFYNNLLSFCNTLQSQIRFNKKRLNDIVQESQVSYSASFAQSISNFFLKNSNYINIEFLSKEDNGIIESFYANLGKYDVNNELINIDNYKIKFTDNLNTYIQEKNKFGTMWIKLGFILGLLICIVLI